VIAGASAVELKTYCHGAGRFELKRQRIATIMCNSKQWFLGHLSAFRHREDSPWGIHRSMEAPGTGFLLRRTPSRTAWSGRFISRTYLLLDTEIRRGTARRTRAW
jgi:hypothetical protein